MPSCSMGGRLRGMACRHGTAQGRACSGPNQPPELVTPPEALAGHAKRRKAPSTRGPTTHTVQHVPARCPATYAPACTDRRLRLDPPCPPPCPPPGPEASLCRKRKHHPCCLVCTKTMAQARRGATVPRYTAHLFVPRRILGEYLGGAVTCDAHHMTDPRADGLGVSTCINLALKVGWGGWAGEWAGGFWGSGPTVSHLGRPADPHRAGVSHGCIS